MDWLVDVIFASQWRVVVSVTCILLLAAEVGYRGGRRDSAQLGDGQKNHIATIEVAVLGLLALLLGFTFSMAVQGFEARRALVVKESNSIHTAFLQADLLPDEHRDKAKELLKQYLALRLEFGTAKSNDPRIVASEEESKRVQLDVWNQAVAGGRESPTSLVASSAASINDMIAVATLRGDALERQVPGMVWLLVLMASASGVGICGYTCAMHGKRVAVSQLALPLLIAIVITILSDLDAPRRGLINYSQESMLDVKRRMSSAGSTP